MHGPPVAVASAGLRQPMLQRIERCLGFSWCRLRGEGDVFRRNLSRSDGSEIERGRASDGAGAKRLVHPAENVYVKSKQAQVERNMGSAAFDTLRVAKRLGAAGFDSGQAESLATIFAESITDKLATKDDLGDVEKRLDMKIDNVEERLTSKFEQRLPLTFELASLATTLGVRHGLVILDAQQYHSGGCLVGGTSVKGGIVFERVLICYGPVGNISASSGLFILLDMAR